MSDIVDFPAGGYRFINGGLDYTSLGVAALPGFRLERARFQSPLPLESAFQRIADIVAEAKRPPAALAACELRSPAQFTEAGFRAFNERNFKVLRDFGFSCMDGINPISRTNVCPLERRFSDTCVHAFSYTVEDKSAEASLVLAGAVDLLPGDGDLRDLIVAPDQVDPAGISKKAGHALKELERRMSLLGFDWPMITGNNLYCAHDIFHALTQEIAVRGAAQAGLTWHLCRPPVSGLEFEMDIRSVTVERTI